MRKKEQLLWDRLRKALTHQIYLERIENVVSPGRPDVDAMWEGVVVPLELKALNAFPKRESTPVLGRQGLSQNQLNWWLRWRRYGGPGFIVISVTGLLYAIPAALSEDVNRMNKSELEPFRVTWQKLAELIKKESRCLQSQCNTRTSPCDV